MIPKITKGTRTRGLLEYLWGPGKSEEHTNPHLIAGYDSPGVLEPSRDASGRVLVADLAHRLDAPQRAAGQRGNPQYVWQCSLSLPPDDREVSEEEWRQIATRFVEEMGFTGDEGNAGCRWIAMHHGRSSGGNDHVHLVVTLATEDGAPVWPRRDFPRAQAVARNLEVDFNLDQRCRRDDTTKRPASTRAEVEAARRDGRVGGTDRDVTRRTVRAALAGATSEAEWIRRMGRAGLLVAARPDRQHPNRVAGYAVARRPTPAARPRWFGGSKLDGELSLREIRKRWSGQVALTPAEWKTIAREPAVQRQLDREERAEIWRRTATALETLSAQLGEVSPESPEWPQLARASADALAQVAAVAEPSARGPVSRAADSLARATAPTRRGEPSPAGTLATQLGRVSLALALAGRIGGQDDAASVALLVVQAARLALRIAELRAAQRDMHAAAAARAATRHLVPVVRAAGDIDYGGSSLFATVPRPTARPLSQTRNMPPATQRPGDSRARPDRDIER